MKQRKKIAEIIKSHESQISQEVVNHIYSEDDKLWKPYGDKGRQMSERDVSYHLPYLIEAIKSDDFTVFTDYIRWVQKLFSDLQLPPNTMQVTLRHMQKVIESYLDNEMTSVVSPVFEEAENTLKEPVEEVNSFIDESQPQGKLLEDYFEAMIAGDRKTAQKVVFAALDSGVSVKDIYMHVFQPSQYEIGRLWQTNIISVAKEHFASAATQQIMAQLYPRIFSSQRNGKIMVAANVGGDLHEMGIRMVADFFEMEGWDTFYLGANTPLDSLLDAMEEYNPHLIALSAAMPFHRTTMKEFVTQIKETAPHVKVMIGGRAVNGDNKDLGFFGADGYARDAQQAVELAGKLIKQ